MASETLLPYSNEFPTIRIDLDGKPYRYVYLAAENKKSLSKGEGLYKLDTTNKEFKEWAEPGCSAGEPIFVPSPIS
ncbi:MAG: carotenoid oxygenase family protein [Parachlamydiaceae bacterium]